PTDAPAAEVEPPAVAEPLPPDANHEKVAGEAAPATLPAPRRNRAVNYLAVLSFLFGSLPVLALSVPPPGDWIMPLAGLGVRFGAGGLLRSAWKPGGRRLNTLGL